MSLSFFKDFLKEFLSFVEGFLMEFLSLFKALFRTTAGVPILCSEFYGAVCSPSLQQAPSFCSLFKKEIGAISFLSREQQNVWHHLTCFQQGSFTGAPTYWKKALKLSMRRNPYLYKGTNVYFTFAIGTSCVVCRKSLVGPHRIGASGLNPFSESLGRLSMDGGISLQFQGLNLSRPEGLKQVHQA